MKGSDVIALMRQNLPLATDLFSETVGVVSITRSGTTVTVITSAVHGKSTGEVVTIQGALIPNPLTSLTRVDSLVTGVTGTPHDLTKGYQLNITIEGATESEYNGMPLLVDVPDRNTFTYNVTGTPSTPATGSPTLLEDRIDGYNGVFTVTVIDPTTFTYEITGTPASPAAGTPIVHTGLRISTAITIERALEAYTKQSQLGYWAFVILDDNDVSRDRSIENDATTILVAVNARRVRQIENFSIYVAIPTTASIVAGDERDAADNVMVALFKSILGAKIPSNLSSERAYAISSVGDGLFGYEKAFYVHRFTFQTVRDILGGDMVPDTPNRAFRDIGLETVNTFDEILTSVTTNLDGDG